MNRFEEVSEYRKGEQKETQGYAIDAILSHTTLSGKKPDSLEVTLAALEDRDPVHIIDFQALDPVLEPQFEGTELSHLQEPALIAADVVKKHIHLRLMVHHLQFEGLQMVFGDALSSELPRFSNLPDFLPYAHWRLEQQSRVLQEPS
ncbi:MAG: hypothetical protein RLZZ455_608 [Candidatus Parcubacteria bacterium]|jgi:hypothetical protein